MDFLKKLKEDKKNEISIKELELNEESAEEKEWLEREGQLVVDVFQTNSKIIVQSPVACVKPKDLDISIENDILTIKGKRKRPAFAKAIVDKAKKLYQECWWGPFSRKIVIPEEVNPEKISAYIKNGVLTIELPIIHKEKERKIAVK